MAPLPSLRPGDRASPDGGIVRAARRPAGWVAPGPRPAERSTRLFPGEDLCHLLGDWRIVQRVHGHRWSLDDLVTAAVAAEAPTPTCALDLGTGIGSVLLMLAWTHARARLVGIEAQPLSVDLCRRSIHLNGVEDRVEVRLGDLRDPDVLPEGAMFDLVTGTPPYHRPTQGVVSDRPQRGPCRFELRGGIEAYVEAAERALARDGTFVVCEDARQRGRVESAVTAGGLFIHRALDVVPKADKDPLFSVFTCRRRRPSIVGESRLVVRDATGAKTDAFRDLRRRMGLPH